MLGTQLFASATPFKRSHTLPPSEMKSLYGSITRSAVSLLSNATFAMISLQHSYVGGVLCLSGFRRVTGEGQVARFDGRVAGKAGAARRLDGRFAVVKSSALPATGRGVFS